MLLANRTVSRDRSNSEVTNISPQCPVLHGRPSRRIRAARGRSGAEQGTQPPPPFREKPSLSASEDGGKGWETAAESALAFLRRRRPATGGGVACSPRRVGGRRMEAAAQHRPAAQHETGPAVTGAGLDSTAAPITAAGALIRSAQLQLELESALVDTTQSRARPG